MKYLGKPYLTLFVFSVLFLLLFHGFYEMWMVYYLPYFEEEYQWYSFGKLPGKVELLFSGFKSGRAIISTLLIGISLIILARKLNTFKKPQARIWLIIYTSFSWTVLCTALYLIAAFIGYKTEGNFADSFSLEIIRNQLPFFMFLYFILVLPVVAVLYKSHNKIFITRDK